MPNKPSGPRKSADSPKETSSNAAGGDQPTRLDAAQVTINPQENILTLNPGQTLNEAVVVTIPAGMPIQNVKLVPFGAIAPFVTVQR